MNIQNLSDRELLSRTRQLVSRERELLTEIVHHLREVSRRRLFSSLGYKSLFEYAVKELRYSEDQAYRRINAMKLVREVPEIEEKLNQGTLTLSVLDVAGTLFKLEPMSAAKKLEVVEAMEGKSRRQAEAIAQNFTNRPKAALKPQRVGDELRIQLTPELEEKMSRVKGLLAHSHPGISAAELLEKLCDEFLAKKVEAMTPRKTAPPRRPASKSVPVGVRRAVWQRDHGQCRQCGSHHALEFDHIHPKSLGGSDDSENLRLLCRSCNQRAAIEKLGFGTMAPFLERPRGPEKLREV